MKKHIKRTSMLKMAAGLSLWTLMAISMAGCGISGTAHETASAETTVQSGQPDKTESSSAAASQTEPMVDMPDPFTPCESMKDAEQLVGFSVTLPDSITGYDAPEFSVIKDEQLIQADYQKGDQRLYIRKAVGTEDISGDYNHYPEATTLAVGNRSVTMRGENGQIRLAVWTDGGYTYCIGGANASANEMSQWISAVK